MSFEDIKNLRKEFSDKIRTIYMEEANKAALSFLTKNPTRSLVLAVGNGITTGNNVNWVVDGNILLVNVSENSTGHFISGSLLADYSIGHGAIVIQDLVSFIQQVAYSLESGDSMNKYLFGKSFDLQTLLKEAEDKLDEEMKENLRASEKIINDNSEQEDMDNSSLGNVADSTMLEDYLSEVQQTDNTNNVEGNLP